MIDPGLLLAQFGEQQVAGFFLVLIMTALILTLAANTARTHGGDH